MSGCLYNTIGIGVGVGMSYNISGGGGQPIELLLTSTGDGSGVAQLGMTASEDTVITLGDNAKFYSDAAGTLDESSTLTIGTTETTRYLKCTTGTATFTISDNTITRWDIADGDGWVSSTNAPSIGGSIELMTSLTFLYVRGSNTLSGSVAGLTSLTYLHVDGSNTLSGSVAGLTSLTYLRVGGFNTLSGSVAGLTSLRLLRVEGSNTLSGSVAGLTSLTYMYVKGSNTLSGSVAGLTSLTFLLVRGSNTLSGSVAGLTSLTYIYVRGLNTLSGDLNPIVSDLTYCMLLPCDMDTYTSGATWGNATVDIQPSEGYGYSSTEIDNMLIDMANSASGPTGKTIRLIGSSAARTSASDAAVATLTDPEGRNCSVTTN